MRSFLTVPALCCVLIATSEARSDLVLSAGDFFVSPGATLTFPVTIDGPDSFQNLSLAIAIGDGGPAIGTGTETVQITAIDFLPPVPVGPSVWNGFVLNTSVGVPLPSASATIANVGINQAGTDTTSANRVVMTVTLDFSSVDSSRVGETIPVNLNAAGLTSISNSSGLLPTLSFNHGSVSVVPEPSQLLLLGSVACVVLPASRFFRRKSRRRRCVVT